jgi:TctA family transporter
MFLLSIKMITCYFFALTIINIPLFIEFYSNSSQFSGLQDYLSGLSIASIGEDHVICQKKDFLVRNDSQIIGC